MRAGKYPRYIYQRKGGPLVRWDSPTGRPPTQARGADAKSLGSLGGGAFDVEFDGRRLPVPGGPEFIGDADDGLGAIPQYQRVKGGGSCCDNCTCGVAGVCPDCRSGAGRVGGGIGTRAMGDYVNGGPPTRAAGRVGSGIGAQAVGAFGFGQRRYGARARLQTPATEYPDPGGPLPTLPLSGDCGCGCGGGGDGLSGTISDAVGFITSPPGLAIVALVGAWFMWPEIRTHLPRKKRPR